MIPFGDEPMPTNPAARHDWIQRRAAQAAAQRKAELAEQAAAAPKGPTKAGMAFPGTPPTVADLDAIHAHRVADHAADKIRGELFFASVIAAAPGLVRELRKVTDELGR